MDVTKYIVYLTSWLKQQVLSAGAQGLIIGVSGGVDSAVCAVLAKKVFPKNTLALILPFRKPENIDDALSIVKKFKIKFKVFSLSETYHQILSILKLKHDKKTANILPRLRMTTLYAIAQKKNYLVVATSNLCEWQTGYFAKHGDAAGDLAPLLSLTKSDVVKLAEHLKIPTRITTKAPSAGFWPEQTDEKEMGVSYVQIERYLKKQKLDLATLQKIQNLQKITNHKRVPIPHPKSMDDNF